MNIPRLLGKSRHDAANQKMIFGVRQWWTVIFGVWLTEKLLIPLGRGDQGDCPCGGGVRNGDLWWPDGASEADGIHCCHGCCCCCLRLRRWLGCWRWGEDAGGDKVEVGWPELVAGAADQEKRLPEWLVLVREKQRRGERERALQREKWNGRERDDAGDEGMKIS